MLLTNSQAPQLVSTPTHICTLRALVEGVSLAISTYSTLLIEWVYEIVHSHYADVSDLPEIVRSQKAMIKFL